MTTEALPPETLVPAANDQTSETEPRKRQAGSPEPGAPTSNERDRVVHEYDGIQEYDNRLPNWWLYILFATMAFGLCYWVYYHTLKAGEMSYARYEREMAADYAAAAARARALGAVTPESLRTLARDPRTVDEGRQIYAQNCAACHGPGGGGLIGPNLTDEFWIHGGAPDRVFRTVSEGVISRGMPAWGQQLGPQRVQSVVAYLLTIRNTHVSGRPPQGQREE